MVILQKLPSGKYAKRITLSRKKKMKLIFFKRDINVAIATK